MWVVRRQTVKEVLNTSLFTDHTIELVLIGLCMNIFSLIFLYKKIHYTRNWRCAVHWKAKYFLYTLENFIESKFQLAVMSLIKALTSRLNSIFREML